MFEVLAFFEQGEEENDNPISGEKKVNRGTQGSCGLFGETNAFGKEIGASADRVGDDQGECQYTTSNCERDKDTS